MSKEFSTSQRDALLDEQTRQSDTHITTDTEPEERARTLEVGQILRFYTGAMVSTLWKTSS